MTCKHMNQLEEIFGFLNYKDLEGIKSAVCGALCNGSCKEEYIEKGEI